jgi:MFS family permease
MISSAAEDERTNAGSLFNLIVNSLGFLPSPTIYGIVQTMTGGGDSRWGLIFIMSMSLLSLTFLLTFNAIKSRERREEDLNDKSTGKLDANSDEEIDDATNVSFG